MVRTSDNSWPRWGIRIQSRFPVKVLASLSLGFVLAVVDPSMSPRPVAQENTRKVFVSSDPKLDLGTIQLRGGTRLHFWVAIGSGAHRHPSLPPTVFQTVTDRPPRFSCKKLANMVRLRRKSLCGNTKRADFYPLPDFAPSIYTIELLGGGRFRVLEVTPLRDGKGRKLSGPGISMDRSNPWPALDLRGRQLLANPGVVDPEALVRLADGSYWLADESVPSLVRVSREGRVLLRIVPEGREAEFAGAGYPVRSGLPRILTKRRKNRGFESLALSPDERHLYFATQSPLANPDSDAAEESRLVRFFKYDRIRNRVVAEYVYQLEPSERFRLDETAKQGAVKVSEMTAIGPDRLLVLEQVQKSTKLFSITLTGATNILGSRWDDIATLPSLEQTSPDSEGIEPLKKVLRFDTDIHGSLPEKIEGMALMGDGRIALINDNDFGLEGNRTLVVTIRVSLEN